MKGVPCMIGINSSLNQPSSPGRRCFSTSTNQTGNSFGSKVVFSAKLAKSQSDRSNDSVCFGVCVLYVSQLRLQSIYLLALANAALTGNGICLLFSFLHNLDASGLGFQRWLHWQIIVNGTIPQSHYECIEQVLLFPRRFGDNSWEVHIYLSFHYSWNQSTSNRYLAMQYQLLKSGEGSVRCLTS